jgi:excisionase family DNA binding protein
LAREVAALRRAFARLLKVFDQPTTGADFTINQWCTRRGISRAHFYKMAKAGRGPRVIMVGGLRRISREADQEWEQRWGHRVTEVKIQS